MSKTLAKAAIVVAAVAAIATGVGAVAAAGSALALAAGTVASIATAAATALSVGAALTAPKAATPEAAGSQTEFRADPDAGIPVVVGRTGTAGNILFRRGFDTRDAGTNDRQAFVAGLSLGPVDGIEGMTVDRVPTFFGGTGAAIGAFAGFMWSMTQLGAIPEASAIGFGAGAGSPPGWTAQHKLSGKAAASWTLRFDTKSNLYQGGVPAPMWTVRGRKFYDPRKDSTYPGGSGSHRWADPADTAAFDAATATWEYSEDPYVVGLGWALGLWQRDPTVAGSTWQRVMGIGAPIGAVDVGSFVEGANVAAANGWAVGGVIFSGDGKWDSLKKILQAGMGEPLALGARISCLVNCPKVSLARIGIDDVVGEATVAATRSRRDRFNTVTPRYRLEANNWELLPGAPITVPAYVAEDRGKRSKLLDYPFIQNSPQVGTAVRYDIENAREFGPIVLPLRLLWMGFKPGDCVSVDLTELGLNGQPILLLNRELEPASGIVTMTARSETNAKHGFALGQTATPPPSPGVTGMPVVPAPGPNAWSIAAISIVSDGVTVPALVVEGAVDLPTATEAVFEHRPFVNGQASDAGWLSDGIDPPTATRKVINGVQAATAYEVAVSYRSRGVASVRRVIGPATTASYQGVAAISALLTNESHTLAADAAGAVTSYAGATGRFRVFVGDGDESAAFALSTAPDGNPQALAVTYNGQSYTVTGGLDANEPSATLTIRATGSGQHAGTTIDKVFSLGKSKAGANGTAAKLLTVTSTSQTLTLDASGALAPGGTAQNIVFTPQRQNTAAKVTWTVKDQAGTTHLTVDSQGPLTLAAGDMLSVINAAPNGRQLAVTGTITEDGQTLSDTISVAKVQQGTAGASAPLLLTQWSVDGSTGWHAGFREGDLFLRQSNDNGATYGAAVRVVGEEGLPGVDGEYTSYIFTRSATQPATPTGPAPSGWSGGPPAGSDFLWQSLARFRDAAPLTGWSTPVRISGDPGKPGKDGTDGLRGDNGKDGTTWYTYFAYANSPDGQVDFTNAEPGTRAYVGTGTGTSPNEPASPIFYSWSPYRGPKFGMSTRGTAVLAGEQVIKNGGPTEWDSDAFSTVGYRAGAVASFRLVTSGGQVMAGLNTDPLTDAGPNSIDYAVYRAGGNAYAFESGNLVQDFGACDDTTRWTVVYTNNAITYTKNGVVMPGSRPVAGNLLFYFDSSLMTPGARIADVDFVPRGSDGKNGEDGQPGTPGAPATGAGGVSVAGTCSQTLTLYCGATNAVLISARRNVRLGRGEDGRTVQVDVNARRVSDGAYFVAASGSFQDAYNTSIVMDVSGSWTPPTPDTYEFSLTASPSGPGVNNDKFVVSS